MRCLSRWSIPRFKSWNGQCQITLSQAQFRLRHFMGLAWVNTSPINTLGVPPLLLLVSPARAIGTRAWNPRATWRRPRTEMAACKDPQTLSSFQSQVGDWNLGSRGNKDPLRQSQSSNPNSSLTAHCIPHASPQALPLHRDAFCLDCAFWNISRDTWCACLPIAELSRGQLERNYEISISWKTPGLCSFGSFITPFLRLLHTLSWQCHVACGILAPPSGIELMHPAVEVPTHWTAREVLPHAFPDAGSTPGPQLGQGTPKKTHHSQK